jgi:hypothetical protein
MAMRPDEDKELFKLGKFKRAAPKVETRHQKHMMGSQIPHVMVHRDDVSELTDDFGDVERSMNGRGLTSTDVGNAKGGDYYETPMGEGGEDML